MERQQYPDQYRGSGGERPRVEYEYRPGDWSCDDCQAQNYSTRERCFKCGRYRDGGRHRFQQEPHDDFRGGRGGYRGGGGERGGGRREDRRPPQKKKKGDFFCSVCGHLNFATRTECQKCGKRKDQDLDNYDYDQRLPPTSSIKPGDWGHGEKRVGDWNCGSCQAHNFASRRQCFKCGEPNKNDSGEAYQEGDWRCFDCGTKNTASQDSCQNCSRQKTVRRSGDIDCPQCGKLNFAFRKVCITCKTSLQEYSQYQQKPQREGGIRERSRSRDRQDFKTGDWNCNNCNFHNFATRQVCKDCGNPRNP